MEPSLPEVMVIGCAAPDPRAQTPAQKVRFGVDRVFGQYEIGVRTKPPSTVFVQAKQFGGHVEARVFGIAGAPFGNVRVSFDHPAKLCFNVFRQDGRIARKVPRAQALVGELEEPQRPWSRSKDGQSTIEA